MSKSRRALFVACVLVAGILIGCATSPTGRSQLVLHSEPEMAAMGVAAFDQMRSEKPRSTNAAQTALVQCVAGAITRTLTPADTRAIGGNPPWEVELFDDDSANAFALPGGKMGVNTGLLDVAENPAQLAAVLGHEVGHVLARHSNERLSGTTFAQLGLGTVAIIAGGDTPQKQQLMAALGVGAQLGIMKFSRTHESEADEIGLDLMARAGFDPREAVTLWQNMARAAAGQAPPEFLSTHPSHSTRITQLRAAMPEAIAIYERSGRRNPCR